MPNVVRFTLSTARNLDVPGAGSFVAGVLDVDANNIAHVARVRYLVQPYRAVEVGIVDSATPFPSLPAVPVAPIPDPYPQYPTMDEIVASTELRAVFAAATFPAAAAAAGAVGVFDQATSSYNVKPSNTRRLLRGLARARSGTGFLRVAGAGDSTMAGSSATAPQAWPYLLTKRAAARDGLPFGALAIADGNFADTRWTFAASWVQYNASNQFRMSNTVGAAATFASENSGTVAEVAYLGNSGPFTVTIDGGAPVTVTPPGDGHITFYSVTGLSNAVHTITIKPTTTGTVYLVGAGVRGASGVALFNAAIAGSSTVGWSASGNVFDPIEIVNGWTPDVVLIDLEINDLTGAQTVTNWSTRLQSIISRLRAGTSNPDIVLCAANPISGSDLTAYTTELYRLADSLDLPLIDFQARLVSWSTANADGLMTDIYHPNQLGHEVKSVTARNALRL